MNDLCYDNATATYKSVFSNIPLNQKMVDVMTPNPPSFYKVNLQQIVRIYIWFRYQYLSTD